MIVVDASAAVLGLLNAGEARDHLARNASAVPHLADSEIVHAMRGQVRRGEISTAQATRAIDTWARLGVERIEVSRLLPRIWELRDNLTADDATYIAVAEALSVELLTADARLSGAPGPRCPITIVTS